LLTYNNYSNNSAKLIPIACFELLISRFLDFSISRFLDLSISRSLANSMLSLQIFSF